MMEQISKSQSSKILRNPILINLWGKVFRSVLQCKFANFYGITLGARKTSSVCIYY